MSLVEQALGGDRRALAQLITILEEDRPGSEQALEKLQTRAGRAHRVGITGVPGAGKSTLISSLLSGFRSAHRQVGVVAVDPSSPFTGGALLGDRIRMQEHVADSGVFVRSMASRGRVGGLADATNKVVIALDACGFDPVLVETVGVGQSEVEVVESVHTVVVVLSAGYGDSIQAEKAGLLEIGHIFVVNKADRPGVGDVTQALREMVGLGARQGWTPPIIETVATSGAGVERLMGAIDQHRPPPSSG